MHKTLLVLLASICILSSAHAGKIYKYIDADGNIHYSESKPFEDSKEAEIKGVKTVETKHIASKSKWKKTKHKDKKKAYSFDDFVISNPKENEVVSSIDKNISVGVNLGQKLPSLYRIKFYIDDMPHGKVKSYKQLIADMEPGEHTVYAQAIEAYSRKIIETTPVVKFFVK